MDRAICNLSLFVCIVVAPNVWGQSTISNRQWELTSSSGVWGALMPAYELGVNANGASAFRDNMDDVGYKSEYKLIRRFLGTRTNFETKGWYALADSVNSTGVIDVNVPNPATGIGTPLTGGRTHMKAKTDFYGGDVALRDTWRTSIGGLSAGAAFSYMRFDQKFDVDYGADRLFREDLDTDYTGGKAFVGWDGCIHGKPSNFDLAIGFYDMNAEYRFSGQTMPGFLATKRSKNVATFEANFTTRRMIHHYQVGTSFGVRYLGDMPMIVHNAGSPASIATDDATFLTVSLDLLW